MTKSKIDEREDKVAKDSESVIEHELIIKALNRLNGIIKREEELINQKKYSEAVKLIQDKLELVNFFEKYREKILKSYTSDEKEGTQKIEDIKKLVQNLLSASSRNMNKIRKAQYIGNKTMEIVKNMIAKSEATNKNYSRTGDRSSKNKVSKHIVLNTKV